MCDTPARKKAVADSDQILDPVIKKQLKGALMTDDERRAALMDEMNPAIRAAFIEIEAVLVKHDLAGVIMLATKEDDAGWIAHFPHWSLLSIDGTRLEGSAHFAQRKPGESHREAVERTLQLVETITSMADDCLTDAAELGQELEQIFQDEGLIEVHDISVDDDASIDPNAKPN